MGVLAEGRASALGGIKAEQYKGVLPPLLHPLFEFLISERYLLRIERQLIG